MVLSDDRNAVTSRWPTTAIPYVISPRLAGQRADIVAAMEMLSDQTCLSFLKRRSERDYLHFVRSFGCASFVGYDGGEQQIFIGSRCLVGNIVHEILHAMGFYHEHTRMDRDQYIKILYNNIMAGMEINFKKQPGTTFGLRYDVSSIMHYGSNYFSANGRPTIQALVHASDMGQRTRMTDSDVRRVRLLYDCDTAGSWMHDAHLNTTEEEQTAAASSSSEMLQQLNSTTRGQNATSYY